MREQARRAGEPPADAPNPWQEEPPTLARLSETANPLIGEEDDPRAERYNEWAERLKAKRRRLTDDLDGSPAPSNWSTDALFEESRRVEDDERHSRRPNPWRVQELLAVLDLREGATAAEVGMAYRRLAKVHHPDRFVEADLDIQEFHAHKMREIIRAYQTLKDLDRDGTG
jgi:DnaJ-domain-containing protein 1